MSSRDDSEEADRLFLDTIVEHIPDMIFVKDAEELRFVRFNRAGERLLGIPREQMYGRNDYDFFPPPEAAFFTAKDREVLARGEVVDIPEEPIHTAAGERWLHTRKVPIHDAAGVPRYLLGISTDITDERRARAALAATRSALAEQDTKLRVLLQHFPGALWTSDASCVITSVAGAAAGALGLTPEAVGRPLAEALPGLAELTSSCAGGTRTLELRAGERVFECRLEALESGPHASIGVAIDVTERRRLEAERMASQLRETQKMESLGMLAGSIAHDFNNLLVGMLGNASVALGELPPDSPAREELRRIEVAAERAADLARQMLAYSGKGRFVVAPLDLREVVREMTDLLRVSTSGRADLAFEFPDEVPMVEADVAQVRQVVMNLITNAVDALGPERGRITVSVRATWADRDWLNTSWMAADLPEGTYVMLEVSDTGCGMSPETMAHMFDPFFTTKASGHGLGLSATLGIVRGHRGTLRVYSEPGQGTSVRVLLPASDAARPEPGPPRAAPTEALTGGRVLVVDDEPLVLDFAELVLRRAGFEVELAEDGDVAVERFAQDPGSYVAVLLDMTMPRMGGSETFLALRRIRPDIRVILSSGYNEQDATSRFAGRGLAGFIRKPYRDVELLDCLRNLRAPAGEE